MFDFLRSSYKYALKKEKESNRTAFSNLLPANFSPVSCLRNCCHISLSHYFHTLFFFIITFLLFPLHTSHLLSLIYLSHPMQLSLKYRNVSFSIIIPYTSSLKAPSPSLLSSHSSFSLPFPYPSLVFVSFTASISIPYIHRLY